MRQRLISAFCAAAVVAAMFSWAGLPASESSAAEPSAESPIRVMLLTGQNNHDWRKSSPYLKKLLDAAGHFETTMVVSPEPNAPAEAWEDWHPQFFEFDCVVLDYNGQMWPEAVQKDFIEYVAGGGGVLVIHAANNSFPGWKEYEQMVGLLWRGRDYGYSLHVDDDGNVVRVEPNEGRGMGHGGQYDWNMTVHDPDHAITEGMPKHWMHVRDELYHGQRGPAENVHILLTAFSDPAPGRGGTGKNEPIVWWVPYGEGKVVTNVMGHVGSLEPLRCVGFRTLLYRSCEWLATGECITPIPEDFPTAEAPSKRDTP